MNSKYFFNLHRRGWKAWQIHLLLIRKPRFVPLWLWESWIASASGFNLTHLTAKYFNKLTVYDGITYHSKREAEYAQQLDAMCHAQGRDRVDRWERQIRFPIFVNSQKICDYIVDFLVYYADGRRELVEVKGFWTNEAKLKVKLFQATYLQDHPEIGYRIV